MDLNEILKNPEQIQGLISVLQGLLDNTTKKNIESTDTNNEPNQNKVIKTKGSRKTKESKTNKFDKMLEFRMHKEDIAIDKKLSILPPVDRSREFETVKVKCRICGDEEEVHPSLITDSVSRYKCNSCATKSG